MTYSSDQTNGEIAYFSRREIFSIKAALGYGPYAESEPLQKLHSGWEVDISMQAKYLLDDLDSLSESATAAASDAQIVAIEDLRLDYTKQTAVLQSRGKDLRGQLSLLLSIPMAAQKSKQRFLIHYQ